MSDLPVINIAVLAIQGAFVEHVNLFNKIPGVKAFQVRSQADLADPKIDGIVIPGGESTTMGIVAERSGLLEPLRKWVHSGKPTWGTCAGMIMLSNQALHAKQDGQTLIGGLHIVVDRNHFGSQLQSFETKLEAPILGAEPTHAVFIRAPAVLEAGSDVTVLAKYPKANGESVIVAVQQGPLLATAFHPELTADLRWHQLFVDMVRKQKASQ
eukprot:Colp12_sorted_trinity150504_noHs@1294